MKHKPTCPKSISGITNEAKEEIKKATCNCGVDKAL